MRLSRRKIEHLSDRILKLIQQDQRIHMSGNVDLVTRAIDDAIYENMQTEDEIDEEVEATVQEHLPEIRAKRWTWAPCAPRSSAKSPARRVSSSEPAGPAPRRKTAVRLSEERIAVLARSISDRLLDEELVDLEIEERRFPLPDRGPDHARPEHRGRDRRGGHRLPAAHQAPPGGRLDRVAG